MQVGGYFLLSVPGSEALSARSSGPVDSRGGQLTVSTGSDYDHCRWGSGVERGDLSLSGRSLAGLTAALSPWASQRPLHSSPSDKRSHLSPSQVAPFCAREGLHLPWWATGLVSWAPASWNSNSNQPHQHPLLRHGTHWMIGRCPPTWVGDWVGITEGATVGCAKVMVGLRKMSLKAVVGEEKLRPTISGCSELTVTDTVGPELT
jgi:hypothetical protein